MADGFSLLLWSLVEYFNYTAVALIALCSALMTVFILRLNGEHWGLYRNVTTHGSLPLAYQKDVTQFNNPFFLKLISATTSSLAGGVQVELSCQMPCEVHIYWGASINILHSALLMKGSDFASDVRRGVLLNDQCFAMDKLSMNSAGTCQLGLFVPAEMSAEKLGPPPRRHYPCVVVIVAEDSSYAVDHTSVVALVTVLHLKDSQCCMQTHIIMQYAKMAEHAVFNLQPLFFASEEDEHIEASHTQSTHLASCCQGTQRESAAGQQLPGSADTTTEGVGTDTLTGSRDLGAAESEAENSFRFLHMKEIHTNSAEAVSSTHDLESERAAFNCSRNAPVLHTVYQRQELQQEISLPDCIICQNEPLNCVMLPCRHTCVCSLCFQKLDRCPMCRSFIESYFMLNDTDYHPAPSFQLEPVPRNFHMRFEHFNQRLNQFLGFN